MKKKILFIQPTIYDDAGQLIKKRKLYFVGLSYPLLAAQTPPEWEIEICLETIEDVPFDSDATVIGIGGMGHAAVRGREIAREFKKRGKIVLMGGPMASLAPEAVADSCDAVVIGDAEPVWPQVLADIEAGCLKPQYQARLKELSTPTPRYELLLDKNIGDFLPVQAGRGCPHSCSFCSIYGLYHGRYMQRPVPEVIRDLRRIRELGFRKFLLLDDNIISDKNYARTLFKEIKKLNMQWMTQCSIEIADDPELLRLTAESGCTTLSFGLESINRDSLKNVNKAWAKPEVYLESIKKIVSAGIDVATEMIVGIDSDTIESLENTIDFVKKSQITAPKFYLMTPISGTDYFAQMQREDRLIEKNILRYSPSRPVITHPNMSTKELGDVFWHIYDRLYSWPTILRRCVLHRRFLRHPLRYVFILAVNLTYRSQIRRRIAPIIM